MSTENVIAIAPSPTLFTTSTKYHQSGGERRCGWSEANPLLIAASGSQADSELGPNNYPHFPLGQTVQQTLASQCRRFELCTMRCAVSMQCMQVWLTLQAEEM